MARQRKHLSAANKEGKGRYSSSSGSSSSIARSLQENYFYWRQLLLIVVIGIAVVFGYIGYLETRVNTPFDSKKVVSKRGLSVPELFWGSYRPGTYFGLKTRDPFSLVTGLMWYFPHRLEVGGDGIRHWCEQGDNLSKYGWLQHDGNNFGLQEILDGPFILNTSFVKRAGGDHGGEWTARISVDVHPSHKGKVNVNEQVSLIWYATLDEETQSNIAPTNLGTDITGIRGETLLLGQFNMKLYPYKSSVDHESFLSTVAPGLSHLKETVISSLKIAQDNPTSPKKLILGGEYIPVGTEKKKTNFVAVQLTAKLPFIVDVAYESKSNLNINEKLIGDVYTKTMEWHQNRFNQRFEATFGLKSKGYEKREIYFAQAALSNLVGGIGYFYGCSKVQSYYTSDPVNYWMAPLFTAVPSRSFFPRGFLWDEGFHGLLICQWDLDTELDIMGHWFDLMNVEGWIPREQILGVESLAKVPSEFIVQRNTNANPPTFFLTLDYILDRYEEDLSYERFALLERLYPRLQAWYYWFNTTQTGPVPGSYRWRGRNPLAQRELNPKTLTSGLDDFPRASHPTDLEMHIDIYCWMAVASKAMARLGLLLGRSSYLKYQQTADYLLNNDMMDRLHWSNFSQSYADYGLHTDAVKLVRPKPLPRQQHQNLEMTRKVLKQPEYRLVDTTFGYVNIFPFLLQILDADSPKLSKILTDIRDPDLLWSDYGLRSLAKTSPLYMTRNTEHDPPYWRGQVWININFLAVQALAHYSKIKGPNQRQARRVYGELRSNVINNVIRQYYRTGYIWEQYSDKSGEGSGCRPFTGWSALTVLLMSERF
ncbi:hypothetical protein GWI33_014473 [Rhynchophorus ferrugineus]|uniref:Mannosyl-oligosaccharide glucosidase n=1 Tax=Rhynchophorus ferrugineus TaxID=354439 RepID=A0A834I4G1_RHYFE|nr:hypothetical protein GWI33_014473 [Rhynchophorus ferrugineus]